MRRWCLPTKDALLALYQAKRASPLFARYDRLGAGWHWSLTPWAGSSSFMGRVNFDVGNADYYVVVSNYGRVRFVR